MASEFEGGDPYSRLVGGNTGFSCSGALITLFSPVSSKDSLCLESYLLLELFNWEMTMSGFKGGFTGVILIGSDLSF